MLPKASEASLNCIVPINFECNMTLNCLANDWKKDKYRYSLELSKSKTPQNTILVVGVNPGGQTDPEEQYFGSTIRRVCKLVINNGEREFNIKLYN